MQTPKYIVGSTIEFDYDENIPLYWSNLDGWVDRDSATVFTLDEVLDFTLPHVFFELK